VTDDQDIRKILSDVHRRLSAVRTELQRADDEAEAIRRYSTDPAELAYAQYIRDLLTRLDEGLSS
jgi:hypothetical protein